MVPHDVEVAAPSGIAHSAGTHRNAVDGQIAGADVVNVNQSEQLFEVGRHFVTRVENAMLQI